MEGAHDGGGEHGEEDRDGGDKKSYYTATDGEGRRTSQARPILLRSRPPCDSKMTHPSRVTSPSSALTDSDHFPRPPRVLFLCFPSPPQPFLPFHHLCPSCRRRRPQLVLPRCALLLIVARGKLIPDRCCPRLAPCITKPKLPMRSRVVTSSAC